MSTPDFNICDVCGKRTQKQASIFIITDRPMGPAGSRETVGEYVDLCELCACSMVKKCVDYADGHGSGTPFGIADWFLKEIKRGKRAHATIA